MNIKELFTEDRGVSPVIGVILMVAITVILAAVIGAFVLGLGDQASTTAPQASFEFDFEGDTNVTITHGGGDDIQQSTITMSLAGQNFYNDSQVNPADTRLEGNTSSFSDPISTGQSVEVEFTDGTETRGETIRVVWSNPSGGSSNTLAQRDWPN